MSSQPQGNSLHFGECPECGRAIERPFWDNICFDCQDSQDEVDEGYEAGDGE
jgi:Zn finger protein HypA/HybF involved in hydrogenase expression